jgi:hypothetical protein
VDHSAAGTSHSILHSGSVPAHQLQLLKETLHQIVALRKKEANSKKGYQKTPAFIHAGGLTTIRSDKMDACVRAVPFILPSPAAGK